MVGVQVLERARRGMSAGQDGSGQQRGQGAGPRAWPWAAVAATVTWSLWELRATVSPAQYLNDSSVHEQMVRFATAQIGSGPADGLVPLPRARVASLPALPERPGHFDGPGRGCRGT